MAAEYRVYDTATGRLLMSFRGDKQPAPIRFSDDGTLLAAETARRTVTIWDLADGGRAVVLPEHLSTVTKLAFSPDNSRIATRSSQGVALFDVRFGTPLLTLHESNGPYSVHEFIVPGRVTAGPTTLDFSRDGRQIIEAVVAPDATAGNIRVLFKTWDGWPVTKR